MIRQLIILTANTSWYLYNFRNNLVKKLKEQGYRPLILSPEDEYSRLFQVEYKHINIKGMSKNPLSDLKLYTEYLRIYSKYKPELVLNFTLKPNLYSTLAAARLKIPVINNITGLGEVFTKNDIVSRIVKRLYKLSQVRADHIFFQNREDLELFSKLDILDKTAHDILPGSGIDTEKFYYSDIPVSEQFSFLFLGRFLEKKGVREYAEAAETLRNNNKNIEFRMLGFPDVDNPGAISLREINQWQTAGKIIYLGNAEDVRQYISDADCIYSFW